MRQNIINLSGLSEDALEIVSIELEVDYAVWCMDYTGPELADPVDGFGEMLRQWPSPWPYEAESCLNGLTFAQFYLGWAYSLIDTALAILLTRDQALLSSADNAVISATWAAKALVHAENLLSSNENQLAQRKRPYWFVKTAYSLLSGIKQGGASHG
jgi:hypothetical protein